MSHRIEQLNSLVQQEVANILSREIEWPAGTFVTVVRAEVADDAESAKVWISVLPATRQEDALRTITGHIGEIQTILNKRLVMKFVPKLTFHIDESGERAATITKILDLVAADNGLGLGLDAERLEQERQDRVAQKPYPSVDEPRS